ncbi:MAG TPA: ester cyclase, partial [Candidatus Dormibacteraeota bacterium]|nr:ester cyclase [Candidatus Dormibacteraeota bacterium]
EAFVGHTWPSTGDPRGDLKRAMERVAAGLSEARFDVEAMIAEGDQVAVRLMASATQVGPFMGMPPSGRRYTIGEIHWFRVRDGRIVEHWHQFDQLGLMRQLGASPGS